MFVVIDVATGAVSTPPIDSHPYVLTNASMAFTPDGKRIYLTGTLATP